MPKTVTRIGPADNGRRMSLEEFEPAEVQEGYLYELSRGLVIVSDVPDDKHLAQVDRIREQLYLYRAAHSDLIQRIAAGSDCKLLVPSLETERHPDVTVYKTPRPPGRDYWAAWIPELVIDVVSPSSVQRDYQEKPEDYLRLGVREYWIVDAEREEVLVLRRVKGRWSQRVVQPPQAVRTRLLPGFALDCAAVFRAAREAGTEE
jgi:Uma2 family endonuclease